MLWIARRTGATQIARLWTSQRELTQIVQDWEVRAEEIRERCLSLLQDAEKKRRQAAASASRSDQKGNGEDAPGDLSTEAGREEYRARLERDLGTGF